MEERERERIVTPYLMCIYFNIWHYLSIIYTRTYIICVYTYVHVVRMLIIGYDCSLYT